MIVILMQVKDIMSKKIISCDENEPISKALSEMRKNRIHQLFVVKGNEIKGVVTLNDIVRREFDVSTTKISNILKSTPTIKSTASIEDAAELLIESNMRALPVIDRGFIGVISESDIIKNIDIDFRVEELAKPCFCVNESDNIGKIKHIIVQKNISRVPVLRNEKLIGVVGTNELANIVEQGKGLDEARGWGLKNKPYKEKLNIDSTLASTIMKDATFLKSPVKAKKVIDSLKRSEEVFIINGGVKIITPKDVLKLVGRPKKTAYFQISGLEDEDALTVAKIHKIIENTIKPISRTNEIQSLHMYIEHHNKHGGKTKYSIKAQLPTQIGMIIVSKVWGYNIITALQEAMNNLEREFWKRYEKLKGKNKAVKRLSRGK